MEFGMQNLSPDVASALGICAVFGLIVAIVILAIGGGGKK
jgi:hypothetical protein